MKLQDLTFPGSLPYPRVLHLWLPENAPRAIVQFAHGMAETIDRYEECARAFCQNGIAAAGYNHLGHGPEAPLPGHFADHDGWEMVISDALQTGAFLKERYPDVPLILLGHSMGSFVAREAMLRPEALFDGIVLMGTGWHPPELCRFGIGLSKAVRAFRGPRKASPLINKTAYRNYTQGISPLKTPFDWLSRDAEEVSRYIQNPLCGFPFTAQSFLEMFEGLYNLTRIERLKALPPSLPILIISGTRDPVGQYGKGPRKIEKDFKDAGLKQVSLKLSPGARHELLHETNRKDIFATLCDWVGQIKLK